MAWFSRLTEEEALVICEPTIRWLYQGAEPVEALSWDPVQGLLMVSDGYSTLRVRFMPDRVGEFSMWEVLP